MFVHEKTLFSFLWYITTLPSEWMYYLVNLGIFGFEFLELPVCTHDLVPEGEGGGVVAVEVVVVEVVESRTCIKGNKVEQVEVANVVACVNVDGLKQSDDHPGPQ